MDFGKVATEALAMTEYWRTRAGAYLGLVAEARVILATRRLSEEERARLWVEWSAKVEKAVEQARDEAAKFI